MITSPGMGIYQKENWGARRHEIFHEPQIGYRGGNDGAWCQTCKSLNHYSWVEKGEQCESCKTRENNKLTARA